MTFDLPLRSADGSIQTTMKLTDAQMQSLLTFAINFLIASGMAHAYGVQIDGEGNETPQQLN